MSIQSLINGHCGGGSLYYLRPYLASDRICRHIFITPDLKRFILGPWDNVDDEIRGNKLYGDLEVFIKGEIVQVSRLARRKPPNTYMSPTSPRTDEIFSIRSTNPKPQIRVIGAFSEPDHFVALSYEFRDQINWDDEIEYCIGKWRSLLAPFPRHSGEFPNDYISKNTTTA